ncbi:hypothetical protein MKW94_021529 [Papaver nudicaule]|uniref:Cytochrome c oxidase subunit 6b-1 n=1 Tax=Papaver nudicaule TaxID=74823 RepID=A0AA41RPU0_PAPNU|nr:hypothetical protein [Papaver nudicaule]
MAEKTLTLAEQYALEKEESSNPGKIAAEATVVVNPTNDAAEEKIVVTPADNADDSVVIETPSTAVSDDAAPDNTTNTASEEVVSESSVDPTTEEAVSENIDETVAAEESSEVPEEAEEEKPEIKLETAPVDFRFPTTNQSRHCFTRYVEYHRCVAAKGDDAPECEKFAKYYRALCPGEWVDRWNEQRENGTFPGPL